ncbi:MAG TPA: CRISPR-associated protein Cas2 [Patescibacteria group bacterium]|nr:CRISPR-associated protein Cas2 [Patescibacteria group bacterium]
MNKLLISYDLLKPNKDYQKLYDYLKSFSKWAKPLESLWIVLTDKAYDKVCDELKQHVDDNDKLFVVDVIDDSMAWSNLPEKVSQWLKDN